MPYHAASLAFQLLLYSACHLPMATVYVVLGVYCFAQSLPVDSPKIRKRRWMD